MPAGLVRIGGIKCVVIGHEKGRDTDEKLKRNSYPIFTPKMYVQSLIQYNSRSDQWSMNGRFTWQQSAATGLYLLYNHIQDYDGIPIESSTKSFVIKYSYLFDAF